MNRNQYRKIFSARLGMLVPVAELTKTHRKGSGAGGSPATRSAAPLPIAAAGSTANGASVLPVVSSLAAALLVALAALPGPALAADECGVEAAGADAITCTDPAYVSIAYSDSDGLTLNLDNAAMVISDAVVVDSSAINTNDIVIDAVSFDTATVSSGENLNAANHGPAGNALITLANGRVVNTGAGARALSAVIDHSDSTGMARVTMNGGAVEADTIALSARQFGLGNAETLMTGGTITSYGVGLVSEISNPSSAGTARATMTGGSISAQPTGLSAYTPGSGRAETLMTDGVITVQGTGLFSMSDDVASVLARMDGGSITSFSNAGIQGRNNGAGDVTVILTAGTIIAEEAGLEANGSQGTVRATMNGGSITLTDEAVGLEASADSGDAIVTMTGGTITANADYSMGLTVESSSGASRVIMSGGTIDLQGEEGIGIRLAREDIGVNSLVMSGGTVISSGVNADGIQVYWDSDDATYDLDLTAGSVTGGSGFGAAIRLVSPAGGTVDIGSAATLTAGSSGLAVVDGAWPWDGVLGINGNLVLTTAGTVTGDVLLGLGTDAVNITGGTLNGNIVGDAGDIVDFALGTGAFTYASPYTISGVDSVAVSSGTARINGTINTNAVNVAGGGTLGGSGTINAPVTVAAGGQIAPGNSPGTLTMGALALNGGSTLDFELGAPDVVGGSLNDLINVNGDLTLDGTLNVRISAGGTYGVGVYRLINYTGSLTDNGLDLGLTPNGSANTLQTSVANQINLVNTQAAILGFNYWDGPGAPDDGLISGGNGTWTAAPTEQNWTSADGTTNGPFLDTAIAIFMGTGGTVTVDANLGAVNVSGMQFATDGYRVVGDAITLLSGLDALRVGDGTAAGAGYTATIGSELSGDGTLDKTDLGTLVLTGANSYTGGTRIANGTLQLGDGGTSGSIAGDVTNSGTFAFNRSDAVAFGGVISGNGVVNHVGAGTTTLTGAGSQVATLDVRAGTLTVAAGAGIAAQTTNVAAGATLRNDGTFMGTTGADRFTLSGTSIGSAALLDGDDEVLINQSATFAAASFDGGGGVDTLDLTHGGALTLPSTLGVNFEHLIKRGNGALTLEGTVAGFSEAIVLAAGTAHLADATVSTAELRVESGVTLTGTGSVSGALVNHGVLSPGNSPGTIQIGGNFVQSSSGLLISEIRRDGTDLVDVVGTATLAGTHEIHIEYGLYLDGATRTLLQAAGGVGGTFSTVAINPSALMFADHAISVTTETVSFTRLPTTTVTEAGTNRGRYAEWLDEQIAGGALTPDLESYVDLLLQQPTAGDAFGLLGETAEPVIAVVQNSIATLGAGAARTVFGRFAANDSAECTVVREASAMANCAWVQGMRQSGDAEGDQFGPRYDWDTNGAQFGFDRKFSAWTLGFMLGYADTDTFDVQGGRNDTSSKLAGAYANYSEGSLDISALALYGANDNRTRRSVQAGTMLEEARAEFDSDSYGVGARFSYRVGAQSGALVRPFAEVFYDHVDGADLTEGGSATGDLTARIHDRDGLRATAGFQWAHNFEGARRMFRPSVELGMAHQFKDTQATLDLRPAAAADGAPTFRSYGLDLDSTSYVIDAALDISLGERASLAVGYSGEFGSDYAQRELNVGFRVVW